MLHLYNRAMSIVKRAYRAIVCAVRHAWNNLLDQLSADDLSVTPVYKVAKWLYLGALAYYASIMLTVWFTLPTGNLLFLFNLSLWITVILPVCIMLIMGIYALCEYATFVFAVSLENILEAK